MNKNQVKKKIEELSREIEKHNYQYYVLDDPTIADREYDQLLKSLLDLEAEHPDLVELTSPSQRVGSKVAATAQTVDHKVKMLSLDNSYSVEDIKAWHQRVVKGLAGASVELVVELKMDGISAGLTYKKGQFVLGATRGDGVTGENVTHSLKTIKSLPLVLQQNNKKELPEDIDVRAEVYMDLDDFRKLNEQRKKQGDAIFANPRNATSGSVKLLDSRITAQRHLKCLIHSFGAVSGKDIFNTHWDFLQTVKAWGLPINPTSTLCNNIDEVIAFCMEYQKKRDELAYEVDGVVIKVNDLKQQEKLGVTLKSPRWAIAYKFPAHQVTTTVEEIVVQVGRTGVLTPVANLKPIECAGVVISRSTLHNFDEVNRLKIKKGDRVLVERAGDVIPKIVKVVESAKGKSTFKVPSKCPACGSVVKKDNVDDVAYRCENTLCPKQIERALIHFASRGAMDIEGLGESVVEQLLAKGYVKDLADIYMLTEDQLLSLDLFAQKKADKLLKAIEASKSKPLSKFLFGLGIANVGQKAAFLLAQEFLTMDKLLKASKRELTAIHEIGDVIADTLYETFKTKYMQALLKKFRSVGMNLKEVRTKVKSSKFSNVKFVFTGELEKQSRIDAGKIVEDLGGQVVKSISKNIQYVVVGKSPGSKYKKAQDLGLRIINESEFEELIHEK